MSEQPGNIASRGDEPAPLFSRNGRSFRLTGAGLFLGRGFHAPADRRGEGLRMDRKLNQYLVITAVIALMSLAAGTASAATVSQSITYQGKLTDAAGNPLTGTYSVRFSLYDVSTGGTVLAA